MGLQKWREMRSAILVEKRQEAGWDNYFVRRQARGKGQRGGWFLTSGETRVVAQSAPGASGRRLILRRTRRSADAPRPR